MASIGFINSFEIFCFCAGHTPQSQPISMYVSKHLFRLSVCLYVYFGAYIHWSSGIQSPASWGLSFREPPQFFGACVLPYHHHLCNMRTHTARGIFVTFYTLHTFQPIFITFFAFFGLSFALFDESTWGLFAVCIFLFSLHRGTHLYVCIYVCTSPATPTARGRLLVCCTVRFGCWKKNFTVFFVVFFLFFSFLCSNSLHLFAYPLCAVNFMLIFCCCCRYCFYYCIGCCMENFFSHSPYIHTCMHVHQLLQRPMYMRRVFNLFFLFLLHQPIKFVSTLSTSRPFSLLQLAHISTFD